MALWPLCLVSRRAQDDLALREYCHRRGGPPRQLLEAEADFTKFYGCSFPRFLFGSGRGPGRTWPQQGLWWALGSPPGPGPLL